MKSSKSVASELRQHHGVDIFARTVRRRLVSANLHGHRPRHKSLLTQKQRQQRLLRARKYENCNVHDWSKIICSDESNVEIFSPPGGQYVRRRKREEFHPDCIIPTSSTAEAA